MEQLGRRGPELLAAALKGAGVKKFRLEVEMDVARGLVSRWLNGERTPGLAEAAYIEKRFAIPASAWLTNGELEALDKVEAAADHTPSLTGTDS